MKTIYPWDSLEAPKETETGVHYDSFTIDDATPELRSKLAVMANYHGKRLNRKFSVEGYELDGKKLLRVRRKK